MEMMKKLVPHWMALVTRESVLRDAVAGVTGAAIVLPQAVAFAAIAGLPPEYGLYTAIIPPIVAAIFGSSLVMVSGPTTAISAVVFSVLSETHVPGTGSYIKAAIILAFLVGLIQLGFAIVRAGRLAGFVSHAVMVGFTGAAAVLIGVSQLAPALGLSLPGESGVIPKLESLVQSIDQLDIVALAVAVSTFATALFFRKYFRSWPGFLIAILVGSAVAQAAGSSATTLNYVGSIPTNFPSFSLPSASLSSVSPIVSGAFAIALIGLLEAIAIGRSLAHRTRTDFSANREVAGQGLSNLVGGCASCYPASGSFTRSGVNLEAGATTPLAAIFAAVILALAVLLFGDLFQYIPIASIAGLILFVAFRLIDTREFMHLIATSRRESIILIVTCFVGLFVSLEVAIYVGTFLSIAVFLNKSANPALVVGAPDQSNARRKLRSVEQYDLDECPSTLIVRLDGPLFFGSVDTINTRLRQFRNKRSAQVNLILILHGVGDVDLSGVELLELEVEQRRLMGGDIFVVAQYPPLAKKLTELGLERVLGADHIFESKGAAIAAAVRATHLQTCGTCHARVFLECPNTILNDIGEQGSLDMSERSVIGTPKE
jgi:SulP family sulfate permease